MKKFNSMLIAAVLAVGGIASANASETYVNSRVSKVEVVDHQIIQDGEVVSESRFLVEPQPDGSSRLIPLDSGVKTTGNKLGAGKDDKPEPVKVPAPVAEVLEEPVKVTAPAEPEPVSDPVVKVKEAVTPVVAIPVDPIAPEKKVEPSKDTSFRAVSGTVDGSGNNSSGTDDVNSGKGSDSSDVSVKSEASSPSARAEGVEHNTSATPDVPLIGEQSDETPAAVKQEEASSLWSSFTSKAKAASEWMQRKADELRAAQTVPAGKDELGSSTDSQPEEKQESHEAVKI